jgi:diguanylate cyclase (GGDEF)-like protein
MNDSLLIVDDSQYVHKLVRAHLNPEQIAVHSAYDGEAALSVAAEMKPSLILLDVDMPDLDGFEVCRRLKANPATARVPVMFVTADVALTDKVKGLDLGAVDYITKPFKPEELQARVAVALRAKHQFDKSTIIDAVTGLWNRTFLEMNLPAHLSMARRSGRPLACVVADIDRLPNNKDGQAFGEEIFRLISGVLSSHCRAEDSACHYGDGKFVVLMPDTSRAGAAHLADRTRIEIEQQLRERAGVELGVTCSFGIADSEGWADGSLLDRAEAALYRAQQAGPNSISVSRPEGIRPEA